MVGSPRTLPHIDDSNLSFDLRPGEGLEELEEEEEEVRIPPPPGPPVRYFADIGVPAAPAPAGALEHTERRRPDAGKLPSTSTLRAADKHVCWHVHGRAFTRGRKKLSRGRAAEEGWIGHSFRHSHGIL